MSSVRSASENEHANRVRAMFAKISTRYDLLNHLLSGNMDKGWRRRVVSELNESGADGPVLDVACGTGDLALMLFEKTGVSVVGADFCRPMLERASEKAARLNAKVPFVEGDALALPFRDGSFQTVTIAFGLRNLASVPDGLSELNRVLGPNGLLAVLEFSKPRARILRPLFQAYFTKILPLLGGAVSGSRGAYEYLPASVSKFPDQERLATLIRDSGFEDVRYLNLTGGIAALHLGVKPDRPF